MTTTEFDYTGFHWRAWEWFTDHTVKPLGEFADAHSPSHEQIVNLYEKFEEVAKPLKGNNIVRKVNDIFSNYQSSSKEEETPFFIDRGTTYHNMKSVIEAGKGNMLSAGKHKLQSLGYNSLYVPGVVGICAYIAGGMLFCGTIEVGKQTGKALTSPNKLKRISGRIKQTSKNIGNRIDNIKHQRKLNKEERKEFYQVIDDII